MAKNLLNLSNINHGQLYFLSNKEARSVCLQFGYSFFIIKFSEAYAIQNAYRIVYIYPKSQIPCYIVTYRLTQPYQDKQYNMGMSENYFCPKNNYLRIYSVSQSFYTPSPKWSFVPINPMHSCISAGQRQPGVTH